MAENEQDASGGHVDDHDVIYTLRTAHQNQTQLLMMADHKANVLIGIVAVILTILFTNTNFLVGIDDALIKPFACFVLIEVLALFLALLSIMPKTAGEIGAERIEDVPNPLFFGFFSKFQQEEYVNFMSATLVDNDSARRALTNDLYQIGLVLKAKYQLLKYAYILAVVGVILLLTSTAIFLFLS